MATTLRHQPLPQLAPMDDPEPGASWFVTIAGVVVLAALVIAISALYFQTQSREFESKVVDVGRGQVPAIPAKAMDAHAFEEFQSALKHKVDAGEISRAQYSKVSQLAELNAAMKYPWEDSKGVTHQLQRIPVSRAIALMAKEAEAATPKKVAERTGDAGKVEVP